MVQGIIDELWVVAQLLQIGDSRQDSHRFLSRHQLACRLGLEEVVVQIPLEVCQLTANYFDDLGAKERGSQQDQRAQAHYNMHAAFSCCHSSDGHHRSFQQEQSMGIAAVYVEPAQLNVRTYSRSQVGCKAWQSIQHKQYLKMPYLGRQMVRQDVIGAPEDEVIAVLVHLLLALMCQLHLLVTCTRFPTCQDGPVIVPSEVCWALKHFGIAEACHGIELQLQNA